MDVNILAVILAAVAQFIIGAIWYMPIFGNVWMKIHSSDKQDKKTQDETRKEMMPLLVVQFIMAFLTAYVLAHFISLAGGSVYVVGWWIWLGFIVPTQVSAVIFGGTEPRWFLQKISIMAGASLVNVMVAAYIIGTLFK